VEIGPTAGSSSSETRRAVSAPAMPPAAPPTSRDRTRSRTAQPLSDRLASTPDPGSKNGPTSRAFYHRAGSGQRAARGGLLSFRAQRGGGEHGWLPPAPTVIPSPPGADEESGGGVVFRPTRRDVDVNPFPSPDSSSFCGRTRNDRKDFRSLTMTERNRCSG
jgi:hypothetical protein